MIQSSPARAEQSYRHEAFLWHDRTDFTDGLAPFIAEGLAAGEPVMVATVGRAHRLVARCVGAGG